MSFVIIGWILLFLVGYGIIYYAADEMIEKLRDLSVLLKVSPFLIGLLILGIDPEETIASVMAAINGLPFVSIGNVVGNSIIAISLCFALPALFYELKFQVVPKLYTLLIILATTLILIGSVLQINFIIYIGLINVGLFLLYLGRNLFQYKNKKTMDIIIEDDDEENDEDDDNTDKNDGNLEEESKKKLIFGAIIFFILILIGGELLIISTENIIALTFLDESFFGLVIISFVTNVEEIMLMIKSIKKNQESIGIGAMIGKIIWNVSFTYGLSALIIISIPFNLSLLLNEIFLIIISIYFFYLVNKGRINKIDGIILFSIFLSYLILNLSLI